jgi:alpha-amylase
MGVIMQGFYWDCPREDDKEFTWWNHLNECIPPLRETGFTALWLPPLSKAANMGGMSMGYDPYDYYDLGEFDQKGSRPTWFGSKKELLALITTAHTNDMQVYADIVLNHNNGADAEEHNPLYNLTRWTKFNPKSKKFLRDWKCFHPSPYERCDEGSFGDMPDLCHHNPYVFEELLNYAQWLVEEIGIDGFRYDFVKGYGVWIIKAIQSRHYTKDKQDFKPFGVGECWDSNDVVQTWLHRVNDGAANPASAFDFALRERFKALCHNPHYNLRSLVAAGTLLGEHPFETVTFVENHDTAVHDPIVSDKMLAYSYILTHEGYPCVFWQDYFNWNLAETETSNGIAALVRVHESSAGGATATLHLDDALYIMQRTGTDTQSGLVYALNSSPHGWNGSRVQTQWKNTRLVPVAWRGADNDTAPQEQYTDAEGWAEIWSPTRGYAVYTPDQGS